MLFGVGINDFEEVHGHKAFTRKDGGFRDRRYLMWQAMLSRCYSEYTKSVRPTYVGVVCDRGWTRYSNFYKDVSNIQGFDKALSSNWVLDKDILVKGNKVYSPETCAFIPNEINLLFTKRDFKRGELPIGVRKSGNKFKACIRKEGNEIYINTFKTPQEAFQAYKTVKEQHIKEIAYKWKDKINPRTYIALINYQVEITD